MNSILITGCNRGLGLGLVKQLLQQPTPPQTIIATCRNPQEAESLQELAKENANLRILQLELTDFCQTRRIAREVQTIVGDQGLNVLVNNAGVTTKFTRINFVEVKHMNKNFATNTTGPLILTKRLLPLLKTASEKNANKPRGSSRAVILNISSVLGSIAQNERGGFYPYRASKAALNAITKSLSIDLQKDEILVTSLHPGWVKTDMGGNAAPLTVEQSTAAICEFIYNMTDQHNGAFFQYDGKPLPW